MLRLLPLIKGGNWLSIYKAKNSFDAKLYNIKYEDIITI